MSQKPRHNSKESLPDGEILRQQYPELALKFEQQNRRIELLSDENLALRLALNDFKQIHKTHADLLQQQQEIIKQLQAQVAELSARLKKDSTNSSKPPSSDWKKPAIARGKKGAKRGGQPGHKGSTLKMVEHPDEVETKTPLHCSACAKSLADSAVLRTERRQEFDLPQPRLQVKEFCRPVISCSHCGARNQAAFPVKAPTQYGPRLQALTVMLHSGYHLPLDRLCTLMNDLFTTSLNPATVLSFQQKASIHLKKSEELIKRALLQSEVLNVDETGQRVAGHTNWLHVASNSVLTYLFSHERRGKAAHEGDHSFLSGYMGRLIHDCLATYWSFKAALHGLCGAHLVRELEGLKLDGENDWISQLQKLLLDANEAGTLSLECYGAYKIRYFELLEEGLDAYPLIYYVDKTGKVKEHRSKGRNLLLRMQKYHREVWAFAREPAVPFTNNQAERDLRMAKLKQKINGGFRTKAGADMFARISGYYSTLRKQGISVMDEMTRMMQDPEYVLQLNYME